MASFNMMTEGHANQTWLAAKSRNSDSNGTNIALGCPDQPVTAVHHHLTCGGCH